MHSSSTSGWEGEALNGVHAELQALHSLVRPPRAASGDTLFPISVAEITCLHKQYKWKEHDSSFLNENGGKEQPCFPAKALFHFYLVCSAPV